MPKLPYEEQMERNRRAWNEVTPIHQSYKAGQEAFFREGGCQLDEAERRYLPDVSGKTVAHLCCNCGQDTLSLANLGAVCTGFDQSESAIAEARKLSAASGVRADFVRSNVLDIPEMHLGRFDMVYISKGALVWLPDLRLLARHAAALLKPGGTLFVYDLHPFVSLLDYEGGRLNAVSDYFRREPEEYRGLDYIGGRQYEAAPNYQFMVRLGDLLSGMAEHGLNLQQFHEFEHCMYPHFPVMERRENGLYYFPESSGIPRVPLMMLALAVRT